MSRAPSESERLAFISAVIDLWVEHAAAAAIVARELHFPQDQFMPAMAVAWGSALARVGYIADDAPAETVGAIVAQAIAEGVRIEREKAGIKTGKAN